MKDPKEQELIEARDKADRKWATAHYEEVEADRDRAEAHRKLQEYRKSRQ